MTGPEAWGVAPGYHDIDGRWVQANPETVFRVLSAMGAEGHPTAPGTMVIRAGQAPSLDCLSEIVTEDGAVLTAQTTLPPDLPIGYHRLRRAGDGSETRLIVSPGRCHLPAHL